MNSLKWRQVGHAVVTLVFTQMLFAACVPAKSQQTNPQPTPAPARESVKSSPPDTNRYVRPAIPEDRLNTPVPLPRPRSEIAPAPQPNPR
jgi:hypothetical protein